jgi:2-C-methyl-D-erythritol 4-phosphate cytidylyltransferase
VADGDQDATRDERSGVWCVVVAGGSGRRFGAAKQFEALGSSSVLQHAVAAARSSAEGVVVVLPGDAVDQAGATISADAVVPGGDTRAGSVRAGLGAVPADAQVVLVHDAARPLASEALFARVRDAVRAGAEAVVPVVAVTDTIRRVGGGVVDRDELRAVQTPQGFRADVLRRVHADGGDATDDAGLVEAAGGAVVLVDGERANLKITEPEDLVVAAALLDRRTGPFASSKGDGGDSTT